MVEVRKATPADGEVVAGALASAFGHDPIFCWMCGREDTERRMAGWWRAVVAAGLRQPDHEIYLSDDGAGAAVWRGVDKWKIPPGELARTFPALVRGLRLRTPTALQFLSRMEQAHPTGHHYYLEFLGTRRERQSKGVGSALLAPMLERLDAEGLPAYLESSNPRNVPFYFRHGFREVGTIPAPKGGPALTTMWREPRG